MLIAKVQKIIFRDFEKVDLLAKREGFLCLPMGVQVFVIDSVNKLMVLEKQLTSHEEQSIKMKQPIIIAIDAEWNSYLSFTRLG